MLSKERHQTATRPVRLAGRIKRGVFEARAYHNVSQDCWGSGAQFKNIILGIIFVPFLGAGLFLLWSVAQDKAAVRLLSV